MKWVIIILGISFNAVASMLVKLSVSPPRKMPSFSELDTALTNWPFWLGLICYGIAFLLYAEALVRLPLNVAHPLLTSGAIAVVALSSIFLSREPFYWTTGVGIILVITGVALITMRVS